MTVLELGLAVLACLGHAALWIGAFSRLHAVPLPCWLIGLLEKGIYLAFVALPAIGLWAATQGFSLLPAGASGNFWPLWFYAAACWLIALGPALWWLLRPSGVNPRAVLLSNDSQYRNVAAEVDQPLLHEFSGWVAGVVPGNEVLKLEINEKTLRLPNLPAELEGLTIVHLSDLHFTGHIGRPFFEYVIEEANRLEGELVAVTGDLVDRAACVEWIPGTLGRLRGRHGVFGVLGNHDKRIGDVEPLRRTLHESGVQMLGGKWIELPLRDTRLLLAGDELPWFGPAAELSDAPPVGDAFRILLAHTPDRFDWAQRQQFALMLAGHNHGGQIRLPWLGPIVAPSRYGVRYAGGLYREGETVMHVSRGVSALHPLRFNCLPELTRLVLTRNEA